MENQTQSHTPTLQSSSPTALKPSLGTEIVKQRECADTITAYLLSIWVKVRIEILQMSPTLVPTESKEEFGLIQRLTKQYGTITPTEFAECIRLAAIQKMNDLASRVVSFPTLYAADFEDQIQRLTLRKMKAKENVLQLPSNTGGNAFWGSPREALDREWPKIVKQTKAVRKISERLRDRFWLGGSAEQQAAAVEMLREMVAEIKQAGQWDQYQIDAVTLAHFESDYKLAFPRFDRLIDGQLESPLKREAVKELHDRTRWKIQQSIENGGESFRIEDFPNPMDCTYCAVMDAYWAFKKEDNAD